MDTLCSLKCHGDPKVAFTAISGVISQFTE